MNRTLFTMLIALTMSFSLKAQSPVYFEPSSLEATLGLNSTTTVHTVLHNASDQPVEFMFPGFVKGSGGPDAWGYSWIDSDEAGGPSWEWNDITGTGTVVTGLGDDNVVGPFEMNFSFPFYEASPNRFWINSDGCISFREQNVPFANQSIPTQGGANYLIAWFWDDLYIDTAQTTVLVSHLNEISIIQFNHLLHYPGSDAYITAQVVLVNNGNVWVRYKEISDGFSINSATIGLQPENTQIGLQVNYNEPYIHNELALKFVRGSLGEGFITTVSPAILTLQPGQQETIWIDYSSAGYEVGTYDQTLVCTTTMDNYPEITLQNIMHVTNPVNAGFHGYVTDAATGWAINDVKVSIGEQFVYTNDNGYYEFPKEAGSYDVLFEHDGYGSTTVYDTLAIEGFSWLDVSLTPVAANYLLAGRVFAGDQPIESGFAYAYQMEGDQVVDVYAEMVGEAGWYEFHVPAANYIVKAEAGPNSQYYGDYTTTYFGEVIHWEDATLIELTGGTDNKHIHLVQEVTLPEGTGQVDGSISSQTKLANIPIILRETASGDVAITYSNSDGSFSFSNITMGTYEIFAEITGVSVTPQEFTLETANPVRTFHMEVNGNRIIFLGIQDQWSAGTEPLCFPNPVVDQLQVQFELNSAANIDVTITNTLGQPVVRQTWQAARVFDNQLDMTGFRSGLYVVTFETGTERISRTILKK